MQITYQFLYTVHCCVIWSFHCYSFTCKLTSSPIYNHFPFLFRYYNLMNCCLQSQHHGLCFASMEDLPSVTKFVFIWFRLLTMAGGSPFMQILRYLDAVLTAVSKQSFDFTVKQRLVITREFYGIILILWPSRQTEMIKVKNK